MGKYWDKLRCKRRFLCFFPNFGPENGNFDKFSVVITKLDVILLGIDEGAAAGMASMKSLGEREGSIKSFVRHVA